MKNTVGVGELRQNLSRYLRRVERGERLIVTDRSRPVAELGPPPSVGSELDGLMLAGRPSRPRRAGLPKPLRMTGDPHALSRFSARSAASVEVPLLSRFVGARRGSSERILSCRPRRTVS